MTQLERNNLQASYVKAVFEDMDLDDLIQYASDELDSHLDEKSDSELVEIVKDFYPHLIDETTDIQKEI